MNLEALKRPLSVDEIEFRVQSISAKGWATILAYKDARTDMNRLDEAYGSGFWQRKHELIGEGKDAQLFCSVGIWNDTLKQWCWVQDVGTESNTEAEKGRASDSFKRACFNLGIGRELYEYPFICIQLKSNEYTVDGNKGKQTWDLKLKEWTWQTEFQDGKICKLIAIDQNGEERFKWPKFNLPKQAKKQENWDNDPVPASEKKPSSTADAVWKRVQALKNPELIQRVLDKFGDHTTWENTKEVIDFVQANK